MLDEAYWNAPIKGTPPAGLKPLEEREEEDFGFFDYAKDIAAAPFRGLAGAVEGIAEIGNIIPGVDYDIATNLGLGESETFVGGAVEGISEFATAFIPVAGWVGRGAKVAKMGKMAGGLEKAAKAKGAKGWAARRSQEAIAGGIADFAVIQGHEARLSDIIEEYPGLQNPVTEFLQSDEDDSELEGRLKAAIEGIGAGIVFDSFLVGLKAMRAGKKAFDDGVAEGLSEEAAGKKAVEAMDDATDFNAPTKSDFRHADEDFIDLVAEAEAIAPNPKRKRGSDNIFKRLELETNLSGDRSQLEGVRTFMDELGPEYFDDLGISIHRKLTTKGRMEFGPEIIRIAKKTVENGELEETMIHELWHKLSQNLPKKDLLAVRKSYQKALDKQPVIKELLEDGSFDQARYDELVAKYGKEKVDAVVKKNGDSYSLSINNRENYRFTNEDEWFAETMREVTQGRLDFLDEAAPRGTVKGLFQDLGIIFRDLWVYIKEKFGYAGPEQKIMYDFLKGERLKRQRRGGLQGSFTTRLADDTAGSGGKPPEVPPGRTAGDGGDVPEPSDIDLVNATRQELEADGIIEVETGKINVRNLEGDVQIVLRAAEKVYGEADAASKKTLPDREVVLENAISFGRMIDDDGETLLENLEAAGLTTREINNRVLAYRELLNDVAQKRLIPVLDAALNSQKDRSLLADEFKDQTDDMILASASKEMDEVVNLLFAMKNLRAAQSQGLRMGKYGEDLRRFMDDEEVREAMRLDREQFIAQLGGKDRLLEKISIIRTAIETDGLEAAFQALRKQKGNPYMLAFNEMFINNLLYGPKTLVTNFISPLAVSVYRPVENWMGGLVSRDRDAMRLAFREFTSLASGFSDAWRIAQKSLIKNEQYLDPSARQIDLPEDQRNAISAHAFNLEKESSVGGIVNFFGTAWSMPSRFMGASDEFIKQLNYRAVVRADLMEQADKMVRTGKLNADDAGAFVDRQMNKMAVNGAALSAKSLEAEAKRLGYRGSEKDSWIKGQLKTPKGMRSRGRLAKKALDVAKEVTFTRDLTGDESLFRNMSRSAQMFVNAHPAMRPIMPFIRTPANLLSYAGERTIDPVVSLLRMGAHLGKKTPKDFVNLNNSRSRFMRDLASGDPKRKAEAYGRAVTAFGFSAVGYSLAAAGNITGGGPKDYKQRRLMEEAGWQPYSLKVGNDYFSYQRLDPFASLLGVFGDIHDIARYAPPEMQEEVENQGMNFAIALARNLGSKTYLQGVMDLAGLMEDPERYVGKTVRKYAGSLVPASGFWSQTYQAFTDDPHMPEIRTWLDSVKSKVPGLWDSLDPQRNFMGEPAERYMALGGRWTDWWLPVAHSTTSSDPINREIAALGHTFSPPSSNRYAEDLRSITGPSGQSAYDRWLELHQEVRIGGRSLNQAMNRLIRSAAYKRMSAESFGDEKSPRVREINKLVGRYRAKAEAQMLREFPQVNTAKKNKMVTRRALRTGQSTESIRASLFPLD